MINHTAQGLRSDNWEATVQRAAASSMAQEQPQLRRVGRRRTQRQCQQLSQALVASLSQHHHIKLLNIKEAATFSRIPTSKRQRSAACSPLCPLCRRRRRHPPQILQPQLIAWLRATDSLCQSTMPSLALRSAQLALPASAVRARQGAGPRPARRSCAVREQQFGALDDWAGQQFTVLATCQVRRHLRRRSCRPAPHRPCAYGWHHQH